MLARAVQPMIVLLEFPCSEQSMHRGNGEYVLVVARDPEVMEVLCSTLEPAGYEVGVTGTGKVALDRMV